MSLCEILALCVSVATVTPSASQFSFELLRPDDQWQAITCSWIGADLDERARECCAETTPTVAWRSLHECTEAIRGRALVPLQMPPLTCPISDPPLILGLHRPQVELRNGVAIDVAFPINDTTVSWDVIGEPPHAILVVGPDVPRGAELCIQILGFPSQGASTGYACVALTPGGHFAVEKGRSGVATHERGRRWLTKTNAVVTMLIEIEQLNTQRPMYFVTTAHLHTPDGGLVASVETQFLSEFSAARLVRPI